MWKHWLLMSIPLARIPGANVRVDLTCVIWDKAMYGERINNLLTDRKKTLSWSVDNKNTDESSIVYFDTITS